MYLDIADEFFAPTSTDFIDGLVAERDSKKQKILEIEKMVSDDHLSVVSYFIEGNVKDDRGHVSVGSIFGSKNAIKALDSTYWLRAMQLTDVYDYMPQKRRDDWHEALRAWKERDYKEGKNPEKDLPEFTGQIVRDTLSSLLNMRTQFLAEKVDGIFRGLSGEHVTNQPQGFGKRMIVANVMTSYGTIEWSKSGLITDLRAIIAKFMGRDEPKHGASDALLYSLRRNYGNWVNVDGGALKIRLYMKGTAHIEVHPDMAYRLNMILANLYPMAIPEKFRVKPNKVNKDFGLLQKPLPFSVVTTLAGLKKATKPREKSWEGFEYIHNTLHIPTYGTAESIIKQLREVLLSIGGVEVSVNKYNYFQFDYNPENVVNDIVCSGCIPDYKSHQFYPTPANIATAAVELAQIKPDDDVLEPSAGIGNLVDKIGLCKLQCVEVSDLHAKILEQKGYDVFCGDFLEWVGNDGKFKFFDKIIMNPPFSEGRWQSHLKAAASKLVKGGKIVAILPSSANGKELVPGMKTEFHGIYDNEFANTSISVVLATIEKN